MSNYIEISGASQKASVEEAFNIQIDTNLTTVQDEIERLKFLAPIVSMGVYTTIQITNRTPNTPCISIHIPIEDDGNKVG